MKESAKILFAVFGFALAISGIFLRDVPMELAAIFLALMAQEGAP